MVLDLGSNRGESMTSIIGFCPRNVQETKGTERMTGLMVGYEIIIIIITRMVQLPATAAIEYVAACCTTRTRTRTKIGTITKTVQGPYARSPQVQYVYELSGLSVPSNVA